MTIKKKRKKEKKLAYILIPLLECKKNLHKGEANTYFWVWILFLTIDKLGLNAYLV